MLHILPETKFKTSSLAFYFWLPLRDKRESTVMSLLASVIRRSSPDHPKTIDLQRRLQELYGTHFDFQILKRGDLQLVSFRFEFLSERYASNNGMLRDIIEMAKDIVFTPRTFNTEYVSQEKENLKNFIAAQFNDKRTYAKRRLVEIMCASEPYAMAEDGYLEEIDAITPEILEKAHRFLLTLPLETFVSGDVDYDDASGLLELLIPETCSVHERIAENQLHVFSGTVKRITEREDISQSKLAMGFVTDTSATDVDFNALTVYNSVFGGGAYSKLFNNVREKLSLAYYAGSQIDRFKGVMLVNAGIDGGNLEQTIEEIQKQEAAIKAGDISDDELTAAKLGTINALKSMQDSQSAMEEFRLRQILSGRGLDENIEDIVAATQQIGKKEVIQVAQRIKLDTIYFLTGSEKFGDTLAENEKSAYTQIRNEKDADTQIGNEKDADVQIGNEKGADVQSEDIQPEDVQSGGKQS